MRLGLAANRLHHHTEDAALFRWLRACEPGIRDLRLALHAVGRTHDAIAAAGMLRGYDGLKRYPYGRNGGLMKLVAAVSVDGSPPYGRNLRKGLICVNRLCAALSVGSHLR